MRLKKLTALITLIATITPTSLIFAEKGELPDAYMDDIFRFDLNEEFKSDEVVVEKGETLGKSEKLAVSFGVMSLDREGKFRGEEYLSADEYKESIKKLFGVSYKKNISGSNVTYETALKGIIEFLGYYSNVEYGKKSVKDVGFELGILTEDVSMEKRITRKAYAEILEKVYNIPIHKVDFVSSSEYSFFEGETVMEEQNIHMIKGYVNATWGIDVFSVSAPAENVIEIDNVKYDAKDMDVKDYLGMQVLAYSKFNEEDENWELLYIEQSKNCDRIYEEISSITQITDSKITYETKDSKVRHADISNLEYIVVNGEHKRNTDSILNMDFETAEGYFSLSKSKGEKYDTLVVWDFDSFTTSSVNTEKMDIYLKYEAEYDGKSYIDIPEDKEESYIGVYVDGKISDFEKLHENMAISVIQSADKTYNLIYASTSAVDGKITSINGNEIYLDSEKYVVSDDYYKASGVKGLKVNSSGMYYITYFNTVSGFDLAADEAMYYGYLRSVIRDTETGEDKIILKLFTEKGEWQRIYCDEKFTLDGKKVKEIESYNMILQGENEFIRYKLNDDGMITFIDTIVSGKEEADDEKQLKKVLSNHSTTFVWTRGAYLKETDYKFKTSSVVFMLPDDRNKEDKYAVIAAGSFKTDGNTSYTLDLYTPDEYMYCDLVLCHESSQAEGEWIYIDEVYDTVDEDDMPAKSISGFRLKTESSGKISRVIDEEMVKRIQGNGIELKKNTLVRLMIANGDVEDCTNAVKIDEDYKNVNGSIINCIGDVVKIDRDLKCIMIDINGEMMTKEMNSVNSIYIKDLSNPKSELVAGKFEDIQPGDRIIGQNGWGVYYAILILKK